jgi:hypothetical protein
VRDRAHLQLHSSRQLSPSHERLRALVGSFFSGKKELRACIASSSALEPSRSASPSAKMCFQKLFVAREHEMCSPLVPRKGNHANTHQDTPKPKSNEGTEGLKLMIDTRQDLGKRPPYTNQNGTETLPAKGKHTKRQDYEGVHTSLIPQVNYIEGPAHNSLPSSVRTLLHAPSRESPKRPRLDHTEPTPCPTTTGLRSPKKARSEAPKPLDYTSQTYASSDPPAYNGAPHTRKRPPEDNPQSFSKKT